MYAAPVAPQGYLPNASPGPVVLSPRTQRTKHAGGAQALTAAAAANQSSKVASATDLGEWDDLAIGEPGHAGGRQPGAPPVPPFRSQADRRQWLLSEKRRWLVEMRLGNTPAEPVALPVEKLPPISRSTLEAVLVGGMRTAAAIAEVVLERLDSSHHLSSVVHHDWNAATDADVILFVIEVESDGSPSETARKFLRSLKKQPPPLGGALDSKRVGVLALARNVCAFSAGSGGSNKYSGAAKLQKALIDAGATLLVPMGSAEVEMEEVEVSIIPWVDTVADACAVERQAPQPQQQKPDPNWKPPDPMALATWKNSGHDSELHDETEIMPDDFLWQNLPGRCCFTGHWDNQRKDKAGGPLWPGCGDFVFQPSTGLCVLLPGASEVVKIPNSQVVSGTVSVALLRPEALEHGDCVFTPGALTTP
ncbi:hypothetical protein Ctob_003310 [Chrysochromulina tobinii]|uniref:Flavodoxin-like domain-containing protein n=1 Tax=Chrysochromulina tobinii TaxID=1460289 RepID=A0A0M0JI65_9EUKA|nr:hypothetical protein Ctob_003310 [Chrysochromulina tobinii]|eukprot:KOO26002.1 hypothetical protein Ctob_003310 [Chrysochromulina sp. CCMP291]